MIYEIDGMEVRSYFEPRERIETSCDFDDPYEDIMREELRDEAGRLLEHND